MLEVNYYSTATVRVCDGHSERKRNDGHKDVGGSPWPGAERIEFLPQPSPQTAMGWNIAPDGLEELLVSLREQFPATPLMMDLRGYQVWLLFDNCEWGYGYSKRFGIVRVDYDTLERLPKDSAHWYAELLRTRVLPASPVAAVAVS